MGLNLELNEPFLKIFFNKKQAIKVFFIIWYKTNGIYYNDETAYMVNLNGKVIEHRSANCYNFIKKNKNLIKNEQNEIVIYCSDLNLWDVFIHIIPYKITDIEDLDIRWLEYDINNWKQI
jgi:hypothetical protein